MRRSGPEFTAPGKCLSFHQRAPRRASHACIAAAFAQRTRPAGAIPSIAVHQPARARTGGADALGIFDGWGAFRDPATPAATRSPAPAATIGQAQKSLCQHRILARRRASAVNSISACRNPRARRGNCGDGRQPPLRADRQWRPRLGQRCPHGRRDHRRDARRRRHERRGRSATGGAIADTIACAAPRRRSMHWRRWVRGHPLMPLENGRKLPGFIRDSR